MEIIAYIIIFILFITTPTKEEKQVKKMLKEYGDKCKEESDERENKGK